MSTNFPASLDTNTTLPSNLTNGPSGSDVRAEHPNNLADAVKAIEAKVGIDASAVNTSFDYFIRTVLGWTPGSLAITLPATTIFTEGAAPATPAAGKVIIYAKADGRLYGKDDAGTEFSLVSASTFAVPALTFGTAAAAGVAGTAIRSDATLPIFDATAPTTLAYGDAAAVGVIALAARRDHRHGMPKGWTVISAGTLGAVNNKAFTGLTYRRYRLTIHLRDAGTGLKYLQINEEAVAEYSSARTVNDAGVLTGAAEAFGSFAGITLGTPDNNAGAELHIELLFTHDGTTASYPVVSWVVAGLQYHSAGTGQLMRPEVGIDAFRLYFTDTVSEGHWLLEGSNDVA